MNPDRYQRPPHEIRSLQSDKPHSSKIIRQHWTNDDLVDWDLRERLIEAVARGESRLSALNVPAAFKDYMRAMLGLRTSEERRARDKRRQLRRSEARRLRAQAANATPQKIVALRIVAAGQPTDPAARRARSVLGLVAIGRRRTACFGLAPLPTTAHRQRGPRRRAPRSEAGWASRTP